MSHDNNPPALTPTHRDPLLKARIVRRQELLYADGADPTTDRPAFVRAASGLAMLGEELVVVQDDASFLALLRPGEMARAIALPSGPGGRRRFEVALGNKLDKIDLETVVVVPGARGLQVLAFGSGSLPVRERVLSYAPTPPAELRLVDAAPLYSSLRALPHFSGESMNIEGVALVGDQLRLFQRGNGAASAHPASADLSLQALLAWLTASGEPPLPGNVRCYDLGSVDGVAYGFADACTFGESSILFLACAEDSPNTIDDGEVKGSRLGILEGESGRWTEFLDERGAPAPNKAEGLARDPTRQDRAWVVLDPDDTERPAELCLVTLEGPWLR